MRELQELVRSEGGWAEAHYHLAHAHRVLGRTADARAAYREALRLDPRMDLARLEMATLTGEALDEADMRRQIERLGTSLKEDPRNALLREALARTLLVAGRTREAHEELNALLDQAPLHLGANFLSARILFQEGREAEAVSRLQVVLRANPEHVEARLLLARDLLRRGLLPDAIRHLEAIVTGDPRLLDVSYELGIAYASVGRLDEAMGIARHLEQSQPRDPRAALLRGGVLLERRDFAGALAAFEAALKLDPRLADAHRGAGQAHERLRQPARAADAYRRALALKGDDAIAMNNLAWVLAEDLDRPDEALPLAERAVQLVPDPARTWTPSGGSTTGGETTRRQPRSCGKRPRACPRTGPSTITSAWPMPSSAAGRTRPRRSGAPRCSTRRWPKLSGSRPSSRIWSGSWPEARSGPGFLPIPPRHPSQRVPFSETPGGSQGLPGQRPC